MKRQKRLIIDQILEDIQDENVYRKGAGIWQIVIPGLEKMSREELDALATVLSCRKDKYFVAAK